MSTPPLPDAPNHQATPSAPPALRVGLSVEPSAEYAALLPQLFAEFEISALQWSWELGRAPWLAPLCELFSQHDALSVHLVQYPLNGDDRKLESLLRQTERECAAQRPALLSAHYGVVAARGFRTIAPLPVVASRAAAKEARERLGALKQAAGCPVGIENLAIAFGARDVHEQLEMLWALLDDDPEHFLLLDLHNLYCQAQNYGLDAHQLLARYPLRRVRELHVAGGSWWSHGSARFRRDTHDDTVPDEVLELLQHVRAEAPALQHVFLERLAHTLSSNAAQRQHLSDYARLLTALDACTLPTSHDGAPARMQASASFSALPERAHDQARAFERELVCALLESDDPESARRRLLQHPAGFSDWVRDADPRALTVAQLFERRWCEAL